MATKKSSRTKKNKKKQRAKPKATPRKGTALASSGRKASAKSTKMSRKKSAKKAAVRTTAKIKTRKRAAASVRETATTQGGIYPVAEPTPRPSAAGQSGDLQGLSRTADADSESVDELVEEGNPFEAGVVSGVEEADAADEKEVHTHEVPEDDVPDEYLDEQ